MKKLNNDKKDGITLISLVVTIVVLLILAGVSISTLVGENGVVDNAKKIQNDTYYQIASEEVNQLVLEHKLRKKDETLEEFLTSKVPSRIDGVTRKDDNTLIVKKNGYEIEVEVKAESKKLTLDVVPYVGTYDGQLHDMLTSVNVLPSDAKIEYSIDNGKTYIENIPQIINASSVSVIVKASRDEYKTETVTKTAVVNKAEGKLTLSEISGTITYPNNTAFTVSENTGTLSVSSNNNNIATASVSGNTVTVKSVGVGSTTITVTSAASANYNAKAATYTVTVKDSTFTEDSGVGYYADTDGDGTPDGIIFADFKNGGSGSWGGTNYTISTVTGLKEYYISQTNYNGPFGTKNVLSARGSGNSRFNVMALSDYNNSSTYAFANAQSITSGEWKTPTIATWSTFAGQLKITNSNYGEYGLERIYWSSTAFTGFGSNHSYYISFYAVMSNGIEARSNKYPVRLVRTF